VGPGGALVVLLPVDDDRPFDDDPLRSPRRRARPLRVERPRAAVEPARHAVVALLCGRRTAGDAPRRGTHRARPLSGTNDLPAVSPPGGATVAAPPAPRD